MKIGAVVGRFQIDHLHAGHDELLRKTAQDADLLCVVLGVNENRGSRRNPLDFVARKAAIEEWYKGSGLQVPLVILPQQDQPSDKVWSQNLDRMLKQAFPGAAITLYGGRDSFIPHYTGTLKTVDLSKEVGVEQQMSATQRRHELARMPGSSEDFRRGVIYGAYNQWPRLFMCVDVAIVSGSKIVVGKRNNEDRYRFFGGFVDQSDESLEFAARREAREEAGATTFLTLDYIGSFKVPDYRYRSPEDGLVMTAFFVGEGPQGGAKAGDDIDQLVELDLDEVEEVLVKVMVDSHQPLMKALLNNLKTKGKRNG